MDHESQPVVKSEMPNNQFRPIFFASLNGVRKDARHWDWEVNALSPRHLDCNRKDGRGIPPTGEFDYAWRAAKSIEQN
jgi:hypothetical protein